MLSGVDEDSVALNLPSVTLLVGNSDTDVIMSGIELDIKKHGTYRHHAKVNFDNKDGSPYLAKEAYLIDVLHLLNTKEHEEARKIIVNCFSRYISGLKGFTVEAKSGIVATPDLGDNRNMTDLTPKLQSLFACLLEMFVVKDGIVVVRNFTCDAESYDFTAIFELAALNNNRVVLETDDFNTLKAFNGTTNTLRLVNTLAFIDGNTPSNTPLLKKVRHDYEEAKSLARIFLLDDC